jgi:16S rRNA (cytosine967-C5)-methyltransferase
MEPRQTGSVSVGDDGVVARRLAIEVLERIETDGAYANLLLPKVLGESDLEERDRGFVTELVYGSTRMRRALDHVVDRHLIRDDVEPRIRAALRIGAYQLIFLGTPAHAAVDATVGATPKRARGFVNAVLRKIVRGGTEIDWPNDGIRLSYPQWMLRHLGEELGERAIPVLAAMNQAAIVHTRDDGYRQDLASQEVASLVTTGPGELVIDLCAAPGGKSTHIAGRGATVIGADLHPHRAGLIQTAAADTNTPVHAVTADATKPPFRGTWADAVLVDAPCSGLGSLRRRADARWRITADDVGALADLQLELVRSAANLVVPGGLVVFSVCTLTNAESIGVDERIATELPELVPQALGDPWEPHGRGGRLLPDRFAGDGMAAFSYRKAEESD